MSALLTGVAGGVGVFLFWVCLLLAFVFSRDQHS